MTNTSQSLLFPEETNQGGTQSIKKTLEQKQTPTPLLAQYLSLKEKNKDSLLFFRLGDFYEMFFEDAVTASGVLDIALTRRGQHQGKDVPMCGVPVHSYEGYVVRLIKAGFRVAICEQTETPEEARRRGSKSIVDRQVVRIITQGTVTDDALLDSKASNYLCCVSVIQNKPAVAWCDLAEGTVLVQSSSVEELSCIFSRIEPSEIIVNDKVSDMPEVQQQLLPWQDKVLYQPKGRFDSENAKRRIASVYNVTDLGAFGEFSRAEVSALGALLDYIDLTQKTDIKHLSKPRQFGSECMTIDFSTRRNLEIVKTLSGEKKGTLLSTIDRTQTGAGARLLAAYITSPLTRHTDITARLDCVEFFVTNKLLRAKIRELLKATPDIERALARISLGRGGPRDLASIRDAVYQGERIKTALLDVSVKEVKKQGLFPEQDEADSENAELPQLIQSRMQSLASLTGLANKLFKALADPLPVLARDGNFIAKGFSAAFDKLVSVRDDGKRLIVSLQNKYIAKTGITSLKIKYNQVIGYHIETTATNAAKLFQNKASFIHRQTTASAVRFTTTELVELEKEISQASQKSLALEMELFGELTKEVMAALEPLKNLAATLAFIDVKAALAEIAAEKNYVRPVVDDSLAFDITDGRHPVVENALALSSDNAQFISNSCDLSSDKRVWLMTGPNMAGKSTFLRQNAIIALMAQAGSFVPASKAHIGAVDRLFSRVGASDDLASGRSTFMIEMVESAYILNQAGARSLVILDEIGRGTATYDGLSIAWAVLEHIHSVNKCRALFATHYHELTSLKNSLDSLYCATMAIKEWENKIIFLHKVIEGVADKSYGIHVAVMAGLPNIAVMRASQVLAELEAGAHVKTDSLSSLNDLEEDFSYEDSSGSFMNSELENILSTLNPDELNPKQALELIYRIKSAYKGM
ncbi:MAG: DNA mismatch repair protein MutS [Alphaproteobacteria bacterium]|nr:DNA mismatch repair protein MutS [Alphaproteobacteria bacterium]